ncbi:MAG: copper-binding protein [Planctomycetes bacterium]|nr:copper-binding protein [Planctomycetia bacterium]MBI3466988.1 copper-binding protein [Planctomycetota bacterium]
MNKLRSRSAAALVALALWAGCQGTPDDLSESDLPYDIKGKVVSVEPGDKTVTLDHEDIPGLMKGMVMEFSVQDAALLEGLQPGDAVEGKLKRKAGEFIIIELHKRSA